jgi:hypothetical protein
LIFLNYTKMTKYEALEKNALSEPKCCNSAISSTVAALEKRHFIGGFSACSSMKKLGGLCEWRREWERESPPNPLFCRVCVDQAVPGLGVGFDLAGSHNRRCPARLGCPPATAARGRLSAGAGLPGRRAVRLRSRLARRSRLAVPGVGGLPAAST